MKVSSRLSSLNAHLMHCRSDALPQLTLEYDIREIDEDLYLAVLACRLAQNASPDRGLSGAAPLPTVTGGD